MFKVKRKKRGKFLLFRRGIFIIIVLIMINYVNTNLANFDDLDDSNDYTNISTLDISDEDIEDLSQADIMTRLQYLSKQDSRIDEVIEHYDEYPEELLDMLSRNIDKLDYVLGFSSNKGKIFSNHVDRVKRGTYPLLLQYDKRWGYGEYGENYVAISGCAPTALTMIIVGLTGNNMVTPYTVSQYAMENGYYTNGIGTSWSLMTEGSKHFDVTGQEISLSKESIYKSLKSGHPIICSMRPGDFTTQGHFIVLTGIENGKIKVNDPNSKKRSSQLWDYDILEYQIKNLWSFRKS